MYDTNVEWVVHTPEGNFIEFKRAPIERKGMPYINLSDT